MIVVEPPTATWPLPAHGSGSTISIFQAEPARGVRRSVRSATRIIEFAWKTGILFPPLPTIWAHRPPAVSDACRNRRASHPHAATVRHRGQGKALSRTPLFMVNYNLIATIGTVEDDA